MKKKGPNVLLWAFILVSVGIHTLLLYRFTGLPPQENETYIEIEMGSISPPPARTIPRPPSRAAMPVAAPPVIPDTLADIPDRTTAEAVAPAPEPPRDFSPEVPPLPDLDASPQLPVATWHAVKPTESKAVGSRADYFDRVRFAIEKKKQYPPAARKRRLEGRVLVRFTIGADGTVSGLSIVEASRYDSLDRAALEAVRAAAPFPSPPAELFDGTLELTVPMMFEIVE